MCANLGTAFLRSLSGARIISSPRNNHLARRLMRIIICLAVSSFQMPSEHWIMFSWVVVFVGTQGYRTDSETACKTYTDIANPLRPPDRKFCSTIYWTTSLYKFAGTSTTLLRKSCEIPDQVLITGMRSSVITTCMGRRHFPPKTTPTVWSLGESIPKGSGRTSR